MRFCVGKVPPDPEFHPEHDGWRKLREPHMLLLTLAAIPVAITMSLGTFIAIGAAGDTTAKITVRPDTSAMEVMLFILGCFGLFLGVLIVHELAHLAAHPRFGLSPDSILGVWPKAGVCYAFYGGELSRNRFLLMVSLPFIVLTVVPVVFFWVTGRVVMQLGFVALMNAFGASFDALIFAIVFYQVPSAAIIRNNGWDTYWRPNTAS